MDTRTQEAPADGKLHKDDITLTAHQMHKLAKLIKAYGPKHENFSECHKKCPLFKQNRCYIYSAAKQRECWYKLHELYRESENFKEDVKADAAKIASMTATMEEPDPKGTMASMMANMPFR